ncbi:hypothetical protein KJ761_01955, partial [Patescibacteria group bacterium]|nr:hypothetical protein [Patescibacteria group bacterium]
ILIDNQNLNALVQCTLNQKSWLFKKYLCQADISALQNLKGKDYEFEFASRENFRTNNLTVRLRKDYTWDNLNKNVRDIFSSIKKNYVPQDTQ